MAGKVDDQATPGIEAGDLRLHVGGRFDDGQVIDVLPCRGDTECIAEIGDTERCTGVVDDPELPAGGGAVETGFDEVAVGLDGSPAGYARIGFVSGVVDVVQRVVEVARVDHRHAVEVDVGGVVAVLTVEVEAVAVHAHAVLDDEGVVARSGVDDDVTLVRTSGHLHDIADR